MDAAIRDILVGIAGATPEHPYDATEHALAVGELLFEGYIQPAFADDAALVTVRERLLGLPALRFMPTIRGRTLLGLVAELVRAEARITFLEREKVEAAELIHDRVAERDLARTERDEARRSLCIGHEAHTPWDVAEEWWGPEEADRLFPDEDEDEEPCPERAQRKGQEGNPK